MTSPSQLKYLEAIGIPVWVSRDLVVLEDVSIQSNTQPGTTSDRVSNDSDCIGSAEDILHSLDQPQKKTPTSENLKAEVLRTPKESPTASKVSTDAGQVAHEKTATEIGRTDQHTIYACGNLNADWLIVGESPEVNENRLNQPFAADSGLLITNMLRSIGLSSPREDAYLMNVLKQTFSASDLDDNSLTTLNRILRDKIVEINPKIILVVGQLSAQNLLQTKEPLARLRLKSHVLNGTNIPIVVTYYPSYLLSKPLDKRKAWDDLKLALSLSSSE